MPFHDFNLTKREGYAAFASALDSECPGSADCFAFRGWVCGQQCGFRFHCGGGDWVVERDAWTVSEDHYAAAGDSDVWVVFSGDQRGDSDVFEQAGAGICGDDVRGGVSWSAGAGCAASVVWVFRESGEDAVLAGCPTVRCGCM